MSNMSSFHGEKNSPVPVRRILDVPVAQVDYEDCLSRMRAWISCREGRARNDSGEQGPCSIVAANVHVVTECSFDPAYARAVCGADLIVADGMPLVWASRLFGGSIKNRCYGPDLMTRALDRSQKTGWSHFFYGATERVLDKLLDACNNRWPNTDVKGFQAAPFGEFDDEVELRNVEKINVSRAQILWVGLGCPRQELWIERYKDKLDMAVVIGIGAGFDFLAGTKPQAPRWMQESGLEWFFRLISEPGRLWRRYVTRNPYFMMKVAIQLLKGPRVKD